MSAIRDVLSDSRRKHERRLQHQRDLAAHILQAIIPHISSVDHHPARQRIVEPWNQTDERRLARPRGAHYGDLQAGLHGESDVAEHGPTRHVLKKHVLERDQPLGCL